MLKGPSFIVAKEEVDGVEKFLVEIVQHKEKAVSVDKTQAQKIMDQYHRLQEQEKQRSEQEQNGRQSDKDNIDRLTKENSELKSKLSSLTNSAKKPTTENKQVLEHIDTTRVSQLVASFKKVYDTEWIQAFVELKKKGFPDEKIITTLADILKGAEGFCKDTAVHQLRSMVEQNQIVLQEIRNPRLDLAEIGGRRSASKIQPLTKNTENITKKHLKAYRKELADLSAPGLIEMFTDGIVKSFISGQLHQHSRTEGPNTKQEVMPKGMTSYVNKVVVLVWMMTLQEPTPAFLWNEPDTPVKRECFSFYTKRGVLWHILSGQPCCCIKTDRSFLKGLLMLDRRAWSILT